MNLRKGIGLSRILEEGLVAVGGPPRLGGLINPDEQPLKRLLTGRVPKPLSEAWQKVVSELVPHLQFSDQTLGLIARIDNKKAVARFVSAALSEHGNPDSRIAPMKTLEADLPWEEVWATQLTPNEAIKIVEGFREEVQYQASRGADDEVAYLADLANRIAPGQLTAADGGEMRRVAYQVISLLSSRRTRLDLRGRSSHRSQN